MNIYTYELNTISYDGYIFESNKDVAVIYCHGGAFCYGDKRTDSEFVSCLAEELDISVFSLDYRNLESARTLYNMVSDIIECLKDIHKRFGIKNIHLCANSSGAYLALAAMIQINNHRKYNLQIEFEIASAILISGYYFFKEGDSITRYLRLYPAFQGFPEDLLMLERDYAGLDICPCLLISGDRDGCLEDSVIIHRCLQMNNDPQNVIYVQASSSQEEASHSYIVNSPQSELARQTYKVIRDFLNV